MGGLQRLLRNRSADVAQLIEAALAARDGQRWQQATDLFDAIVARKPERTDLHIQLGNCAKENGSFSKAFHAYAVVLKTDQAIEAELQLGHLFKVTGNLAAARIAYARAAAFGNAFAAEECAAFGPSWLEVPRFLAKSNGAINQGIRREWFLSLSACELGDDPEPQALHQAARSLTAAGELVAAKAFHELAFLSSGGHTDRQEQALIVRRAGLWSPSHLMSMIHSEASLGFARPADVRGRFRALVAASAAVPSRENDAAAQAATPAASAWPPAIGEAPQQALLLKDLAGALTRVYEAAAHYQAGGAAALVAAVGDLNRILAPAAATVCLAEDATIEALRAHATRVLADCTARWLARVGSRYFGAHTTTELIETLFALGANPIAERVAEGVSPSGIFAEIEALLPVVLPTRNASDQVVARILSLCLPEISLGKSRELFEEALSRQMFETCAVIIEREFVSPFLAQNDIIRIAQRLKQSGDPKGALQLCNRRLDEKTCPPLILIEKALIAKTCGDFGTAARILEQCAREHPDDEFVRQELVSVLPEIEPISSILGRLGHDALFLRSARTRLAYRLQLGSEFDEGERIGSALVADGLRVNDLIPEIATEFITPLTTPQNHASIRIMEAGWFVKRGPGPYDRRRRLRRIDFVRAQISSSEKIVSMRVRIDGRTVGVSTGSELLVGYETSRIYHKSFNSWFDLANVPPGLHEMQLYFEEIGSGYRTHEELVWVDAAEPAPEEFASAATVSLPRDLKGMSVEEALAGQPSTVFPAERKLFDRPRSILIIRADQLGDTIVSIPAIIRLKEAFPEATFYALVAPNNVELIEGLGLFAKIFTVDFHYDQRARQRTLTFHQQAELRQTLRAQKFDLAIDLCAGAVTRPLLQLADARFTAGFLPSQFPWLDFGMEVRTRDVVTGGERLPQAAICKALVELLIATAQHQVLTLPKRESGWPLIERFGIAADEPFALLHTGARTASRKWPMRSFIELAGLLIAKAGLRTVLMADRPSDFADADFSALPPDRYYAIDHKPSFAEFDTLISLCKVFVGNDSGPKHLAALRGAHVTSIHMGAVNWSEWGQDGIGNIVARRVPCFGCGIELVEECGIGVPCLFGIKPREVFDAVSANLRQPNSHGVKAANVVAKG